MSVAPSSFARSSYLVCFFLAAASLALPAHSDFLDTLRFVAEHGLLMTVSVKMTPLFKMIMESGRIFLGCFSSFL